MAGRRDCADYRVEELRALLVPRSPEARRWNKLKLCTELGYEHPGAAYRGRRRRTSAARPPAPRPTFVRIPHEEEEMEGVPLGLAELPAELLIKQVEDLLLRGRADDALALCAVSRRTSEACEHPVPASRFAPLRPLARAGRVPPTLTLRRAGAALRALERGRGFKCELAGLLLSSYGWEYRNTRPLLAAAAEKRAASAYAATDADALAAELRGLVAKSGFTRSQLFLRTVGKYGKYGPWRLYVLAGFPHPPEDTRWLNLDVQVPVDTGVTGWPESEGTRDELVRIIEDGSGEFSDSVLMHIESGMAENLARAGVPCQPVGELLRHIAGLSIAITLNGPTWDGPWSADTVFVALQ